MLPATLLAVAALVTPDAAAPWEVVEACPRLLIRGVEKSSATAVVVGQKDGFAYLLTADHAVQSDAPGEVQFFDRRTYPEPARVFRECSVEHHFREADFALLKLKIDAPVPALRLAPPPARPRKVPFAAVSVGCSGGNPPTGMVEAVTAKRFTRRGTDDTAFFWQTAMPPKPGRSGGPLVADGKVVGICAAGKDKFGYYSHPDELLAGLKKQGFGWLWEE